MQQSKRILRQAYKKAPDLTVVVLLFCAVILIHTVIVFFARSASPFVSIFLTQVIAILLPTLFVVKTFGYDKKLLFPLSAPSLEDILSVILLTIAVGIISDYLVSWTDEILRVPVQYRTALLKLLQYDSSLELIGKIIFLALIPAAIEEFYFRGFCQNGLSHTYSQGKSLIIASALFAIAHINPWYIHIYFMLGIFIGAIFIFRRTLYLPFIAHLTNNLWTILMIAVNVEFPVTRRFTMEDAWMLLASITMLIALGLRFAILGRRHIARAPSF